MAKRSTSASYSYAASLCYFSLHLVTFIFENVGNYYSGTFLGEYLCLRFAHAISGPGYYRDFAF